MNTPDVLATVRDALKTLVDQLAVKGVPIDDAMQGAISTLQSLTAQPPTND